MRFVFTVLTSVVLSAPGGAAAVPEFDVLVYGGTAGGVITAVAAGREGLKAAILEPGRHIGGMTTGGLSRTDFGKKETIGGYSLEFYRRCGKKYGIEIEWFFEPKVAEKVLNDMAREAGVKIYYGHRLKEKNGVRKQGPRVTEVTMENGARFRARIFADASYEGDLMAQAGVSYTWGREGISEYNESLAGVRPRDRNHQFDSPVPARDERGKLLPLIQKGPRGELGAADRKVQAYNFRMILTKDFANRVPFAPPPGYDPKIFEVHARWLQAEAARRGRAPRMNEVGIPAPLQGNKIDLNNRGAASTDHIGASWDYPEASYKRRMEIWEDHVNYTKGYLYFMATDPRVPRELREDFAQWGLARDEFTGNNNWPHHLYVREARRMVGDFVMTQKDIQTDLAKPDAIGMGSYNSDSHNVQRFAGEDGTVQNEGNMEVAVTPYQVPYRVLLPKRKEAENLLVPVCVSASQVTYSTLRMEPVYMILGHAAGVAAKMAIEGGLAVEDIDTKALHEKLRRQGAVMEWVK